MAKEIMIARHFLKGHSQAGEPTYFVQKIWRTLELQGRGLELIGVRKEYNKLFPHEPIHETVKIAPKLHTIINSNRFSEGDIVALKVWTGEPYRSKKFQIAPFIEIPKPIPIEVLSHNRIIIEGNLIDKNDMEILCKNDGISIADFQSWFKLPSKGFIIPFGNFCMPYVDDLPF